jgi:hypothetical protein
MAGVCKSSDMPDKTLMLLQRFYFGRKRMVLLIAWCILLALCWPLALVVLILMPLLWLLSVPLRLVGITLDAVFAFVKALLFLPARILGVK